MRRLALGRRLAVGLTCTLLALAFAPSRVAASIIATSYNTPSFNPADPMCPYAEGCGVEGDTVFPTLQQQFTLSTTETITSVDAALAYSVGTSPFTAANLILKIVNDASGVIGSTVFATDTSDSGTLLAYPDMTSAEFSDINFAFPSTVLGPGTYWLVLSASFIGDLFDWEYQIPGTVNPAGPGGTINPASGLGNSYSTDTYLTTLNGMGSSPEPGTVLTALGALVAMWAIRRHRRQASLPYF